MCQTHFGILKGTWTGNSNYFWNGKCFGISENCIEAALFVAVEQNKLSGCEQVDKTLQNPPGKRHFETLPQCPAYFGPWLSYPMWTHVEFDPHGEVTPQFFTHPALRLFLSQHHFGKAHGSQSNRRFRLSQGPRSNFWKFDSNPSGPWALGAPLCWTLMPWQHPPGIYST